MILPESHPSLPETRKEHGHTPPDVHARTDALGIPTHREMIVIIRPSFMKICDQDACRAALFNHLLYWIAQKAKGQEESLVRSGEIYWYGSIEEDIHQGLAGAWGISKIKQELKALVHAGLIGQRRNPLKGWDRTYCYFIGEDQGKAIRQACTQHTVCLDALDLKKEVLHLLKITGALVIFNRCISQIQPMQESDLTDALDESNQCKSQIQPMDQANPTDGSVESDQAIPKDSTKDSQKVSPKTESSTPPTNEPLATTPTVPSPDSTTSSEKRDQRQQATPPTTRASQPSRKTPSSSIEAQPQGKPVMPGDDLPWGPEKMVQITECLRFCRNEQGAFFSTQPTGKSQKSQRDRQIQAARKILTEIPTLTQEEYVAAYSEQNNEWWNREKGSLTVEDMAANTPRKVMRTVELLEKVRSRSERIKNRPAKVASPVETKPVPQASPLTHDEACQLARDAISAAKAQGRDIQAQAISLENGAWGIVVRWNTQYFEKPETMKSRKRWESAMKEMSKIWDIESQERMKQGNNG